uniref:Uncharacterized protein n=1 Tax=Cannabis sativa TaxID=3483 RepID=A0A803P3S4_CANSA
MMVAVKYGVKKFTGTNEYGLWRMKINALLVHQGLYQAMLGEKSATISGGTSCSNSAQGIGYSSGGCGHGRGGRGGNCLVCQLCNRVSHVVSKCYHLFNINFQAQSVSNQSNTNTLFAQQAPSQGNKPSIPQLQLMVLMTIPRTLIVEQRIM